MLGLVGSPQVHAQTGPAILGFEAYDRAMATLLERTGSPGGALAVAVDGRIVLARGYGLADRDSGRPVQPDTRFRIASSSKPLTAVETLHLVEQGVLSLDDSAFRVLDYPTPTYAGAARDPRLDQITVRQLLNHSGGWNRGIAPNPFFGGTGMDPIDYGPEIARAMSCPSPASAEMRVRYMVGQPLQFTPGTESSYSNFGFIVLGRLIERRTGISYEQAVRQLLARSYVSGFRIGGSRRVDLAPDEAVYYDSPGGRQLPSQYGEGQVERPYFYSLDGMDGGGGWCVSAIEYLRFMLALEGTTEIPPLLTPASVTAMRTTQPPAYYYGYGWFTGLVANSASGHPGALPGTFSTPFRMPGGRVQFVVFINSNNDTNITDEVFGLMGPLAQTLTGNYVDLTWSTLGWDAWTAKHLGNTASAEDDDADGDGLVNLFEYAAGLDPLRDDCAEAARLVTAADGSTTLEFRRLLIEHAVEWSAEASTAGGAWHPFSLAGATTVLNPDGSLTARVAAPNVDRVRLTVRRLVNGRTASRVLTASQPPRVVRHPASQTVRPGDQVQLEVTPSSPVGVTYQWYRDGVPIVGADARTLRIDSAAAMDAGEYTVVVASDLGRVTSRPARLVVANPEPGELVNMSVRGAAGAAGQPLIVGYVVTGGTKPLLIRAVGPGLAPVMGTAAIMTDPRLEVHRVTAATDRVVSVNDDWSSSEAEADSLAALFNGVGAFPLQSGSRDAALRLDLEGVYTAHVNGPAGTVLVEVYTTSADSAGRLVNVAARNGVDGADQVLIAGFVINGNTPHRLLIRGIGPGLARQGVTTVLEDPVLELHAHRDGSDRLFATNRNWPDESEAAETAERVGAFPLRSGDRDAALVVTVPAGVYSAVVRSARGTSGEVLVEVYTAD